MSLVVKKFKRGTPHPANAQGNYIREYNQESDVLRNLEARAVDYNKRYPTKEMWFKAMPYQHGHMLEHDALLVVWEDDENEFGPITP